MQSVDFDRFQAAFERLAQFSRHHAGRRRGLAFLDAGDHVALEPVGENLLEQVQAFGRQPGGSQGRHAVAVLACQRLEAIGSSCQGFFPRRRYQLAVLADQRSGQALALVVLLLEAAHLAQHAAVHGGVPIALNADNCVVAGEHVDAAADGAAGTNRLVVVHLQIFATVRADPVDQGAGRADLHAGAAADTGALAQRHAQVGYEHALRAALFEAQCVVAHQLTTSAHAAAAQDAAVLVEHKVRIRGVHILALPVGLQRPVGHALVVG